MTPLKNIAILGSTGSIGTQTLDIVSQYPERFRAAVLVAGSKVDTLIQQAIKYRPTKAIIADPTNYWKLAEALRPLGIETASGAEAVEEAMELPEVDTVVTATVGYSGLAPTLRAIRSGKDIALANKETMVVAGELVRRAILQSSSQIMPVDSEHSAIYQCLRGENPDKVRRLIITASGGPFRTTPAEKLRDVTVHDALHHPNWSMGAKITIDSATMLNKAFEIIEARWLFDVPGEKIVPIVHPQSIIHSMVEYIDGSVKAQLGVPDMRLPIRYALGDAQRLPSDDPGLTFEQMSHLTFEEPDAGRFPCVKLGHYALERRGTTACVINAANEIAVAAFLREKIPFLAIYATIMETLERIPYLAQPTYDDYVTTNSEARNVAEQIIKDKKY
ncbi:MAG: 1-deoxy-D-xylulose-5-phosphate reductoisomerase [Bacteroidales bacterium]|nr:1-deoxy-D-xylulose-5-phosphate reductoisomerase [Bacteroidales bacterium]